MRTICLLLLLLHLVFADEVLPDEHDLLLKLFDSQSYDSSVRPVYNSSKNVVVTFGFTLIQIMDMVCNISQNSSQPQDIQVYFNGVAKVLKSLRTSRGDYWNNQWLSAIAFLFKTGTSLKGKNLLPESHFYLIR